MFEDFSGSMGSVEQVVSHLMEELGIECTRQQYGPVSTWTIPLDESPEFDFADLRDLLESHGEMLAHELPGAVLGIMMHTYTGDKKKYNVTSISVFPKGVKESLYEWMDSSFGNLEVRKVAGDETNRFFTCDVVEIGDGETDYFWYTEEDEPELSVCEDVYEPLMEIAYGYGYFMYYGTKDGPLGQKQSVWWERDRDTGEFLLDWFNSRYGKVLYPGKPPITFIDLV